LLQNLTQQLATERQNIKRQNQTAQELLQEIQARLQNVTSQFIELQHETMQNASTTTIVPIPTTNTDWLQQQQQGTPIHSTQRTDSYQSSSKEVFERRK
jgi:hypothetical protein